MKIQYWDSEGDLCEREFSSDAELNAFMSTLKQEDIVGIFNSEQMREIAQEILLQTMFFPPNKVN